MADVLICGMNFHPEYTSTGKYTSELALAMQKHGHGVRVICAPPYYPDWQVRPGYSAWRFGRERFNGIEILRCPLWVPSRPSGWRRLLHLASFAASSFVPLLLGARRRPDWLLLIVPTVACAPGALLAAGLSGARSWVHVQDLEVEAAAGLGLLGELTPLQRLLGRVEHALLRRFDRVSTISEGMAHRLQQAGFKQERVELIPNWVDAEALESVEPAAVAGLRRKLNLDDEATFVLYAGNLGRKQGFGTVLRAADRLQERQGLKFLIVGRGAERARLEGAAANTTNVILRDPVPPADLPALLQLAAVHLVPQRSGVDAAVLPSKLGGILASGRPLVATAEPGSELARVAAVAGSVVPPADPAALANAIVELLDDPVRGERLGRRGRAYAEEHLVKDRVLERALQPVESG